jgi:hypothetical protein
MIRALKTTADPPTTFGASQLRRRSYLGRGARGIRTPGRGGSTGPPTEGCWFARCTSIQQVAGAKLSRRRWKAVFVHTKDVLRIRVSNPRDRTRLALEIPHLVEARRRGKLRRHLRRRRSGALQHGGREPPLSGVSASRCLGACGPPERGRRGMGFSAPRVRLIGSRVLGLPIARDRPGQHSAAAQAFHSGPPGLSCRRTARMTWCVLQGYGQSTRRASSCTSLNLRSALGSFCPRRRS